MPWIGSTELWVLNLPLAFKYPIMSCLPVPAVEKGLEFKVMRL